MLFKPFKSLILYLLLGLLSPSLYAQDAHYSQYMNSPLNLNPALTAYSQSTYRATLNHKSQWAAVTVPYQNFSASFESKIIKRKKQRDYIGIGVIFNNDQAGDSKFGTSQIGISASFVKALNRNGKNVISLGIQSSYFQRSIDYTQLYFQDSWNGITSNPNSGNTENFSVDKFNFFDISTGFHWFLKAANNLAFNSGISVWHLNKPQQTLMDEDAPLDIKYQIYTEAYINTERPFDIIPSVIYTRQGPYQEMLLGLRFKSKFHQSKKNYFAINYGLYGRMMDALIIYMGLDYKNFVLAATYDFNLSSLSIASNTMGGMELSLKWLIFKTKKTKKIGPSPCPIF